MKSVKRIEIVIDKLHVPEVHRVLDEAGVPGRTVFEAVAGWGDRGERRGGELSDAQVNYCVLTTCEPDRLEALADALEPLLRRYGGLVLISDAMLIREDG